jgi:hypothetical protein
MFGVARRGSISLCRVSWYWCIGFASESQRIFVRVCLGFRGIQSFQAFELTHKALCMCDRLGLLTHPL